MQNAETQTHHQITETGGQKKCDCAERDKTPAGNRHNAHRICAAADDRRAVKQNPDRESSLQNVRTAKVRT